MTARRTVHEENNGNGADIAAKHFVCNNSNTFKSIFLHTVLQYIHTCMHAHKHIAINGSLVR